MEGLLDFVLRDALTRVGGIDRCVSEFIRVTDQLLPERVFIRIVPELLNGSKTPAGVPVRAQLLGSDPVCLAENAARLATLGPAGIDLNFGCPAKLINRHGGGAMLLREPEGLERIVSAVRRAVPAVMPVSAKMRLGYLDDSLAVDCALAIERGGAEELVVHARTKLHAYQPPAFWERIADIRAAVKIPVVANGEIWTIQDAQRCMQASGSNVLMLGRGIVANPGLALACLGQGQVSWSELLPVIEYFWRVVCAKLEHRSKAGRFKQWLNFLRRVYSEAELAYRRLRPESDPAAVELWFAEQRCLTCSVLLEPA